jgi:beta-lactamase superfamily II metal-dependent hydrolase
MIRCRSWLFAFVFTGLFAVTASGQGLRILIFSVGQTDAQLIIGPQKTVLIDCGAEVAGPKKQYEYVADKIRTLTGGSSIDYFVISHYHYDHMGSVYSNSSTKGNGLWGLLDTEGIKIDTVIDRGDYEPYGDDTGPYTNYKKNLQRWITEGKIKRRVQAAPGNTQIQLGGNVRVDVITANGNGIFAHPTTTQDEHWQNFPPSENDYSVVLKVTLGKFEYFTGGDVTGKDADRSFPGGSVQSYNDVESTFANTVGNIEVLRVSHHGSQFSTNTELLTRLNPEFCVISVGKNTYGHPSKEVVQRLRSTCRVFVTTDVSTEEWKDDDSIKGEIVGKDIAIEVDNTGDTYRIADVEARAYSDAEEAAGLDAQGVTTNGPVIPWQDAPAHVNENVTVEGRIVKTKRLASTEFLNFSELYWRDLSAVVFAADFAKFPSNLDQAYLGKVVRISGRITLFEGRPQIVLRDATQLQVVQ